MIFLCVSILISAHALNETQSEGGDDEIKVLKVHVLCTSILASEDVYEHLEIIRAFREVVVEIVNDSVQIAVNVRKAKKRTY